MDSVLQVVGQLFELSKVLLDYVVRKDDAVAALDTEFETEHEKLVLSTPHTGTAFDKDNGKVWIQVKQLTVNGPAWTYVAPFEKKRDGRGAVKALNSHYEGDAVMSKSKAAAFDVLEHTTYTGERRNFGMEKYTNALSTAFQTLDEYGETLMESRKVDVFLRNNHCTDSKMLSGIAVIQGDADRMSNFAKAADYLALFTNTDTSQKTGHSISSAQRSTNKKKPAIRAGNYTPNGWHQLSDKERTKSVQSERLPRPLATRTSARPQRLVVRVRNLSRGARMRQPMRVISLLSQTRKRNERLASKVKRVIDSLGSTRCCRPPLFEA